LSSLRSVGIFSLSK